tara:strand:+ start:577 stop:1416 length:840 start_codon:yes stop_codon:yes gene_type:complete
MQKSKIYCMCLHDHHLNNIKKLDYIPVGLGKNKFSNEWLKDSENLNISDKNPYYGEYTFYYWFWKNILSSLKDKTWIGFTGYRYHWSNNDILSSDELNKIINQENFKDHILKKIPDKWNEYDVILGEEININNWKLSKILKHGKKLFFKNPRYLLKKNRNIKLHFDAFHGEGILDKAIDVLDLQNRNDFRDFVNDKNSFNRENLFFCKSKTLMNNYFKSIFNWLYQCEKLFGFNLEGYSKKRLYAFLAERYISYWFQKNAKYLAWPIFFYDTNKNRITL